MSFRFVHAADVHLGSQLRGLERYEGAPADEIRMAPRQAFERLVTWCAEEQVDFLLLAGDLFDTDCDFATALFAARQLARLREAGIPVYLVSGNHDAESRMTRQLQLPDNVHVFGTDAASMALLEDVGVAIHGRGFAKPDVTESLLPGYGHAASGYFNVGMLHTCATATGHERYAPCTVEELTELGYDYWALGHVHQREVLHQEPWIVFPGNLQGRHARETGSKGASVVAVDGNGIAARPEHVDFDVMRWDRWTIVADESDTAADVVERIRARCDSHAATADMLAAVRIEIAGRSEADREFRARPDHWLHEVRNAANDRGLDSVWIEKVTFATRAVLPPVQDILERDDSIGALVRSVESLRTDAERRFAVAECLEKLEATLPADLLTADTLGPFDAAAVEAALDSVRDDLVARLLDRELAS